MKEFAIISIIIFIVQLVLFINYTMEKWNWDSTETGLLIIMVWIIDFGLIIGLISFLFQIIK